jgi:long-chain-fatty-acid--CoA ligase ACSBG
MVVGDQQKYLSCLLTLKVVQDEVTGLPTNQLAPLALEACRRVGSTAQTVTDILELGDHKVLKMIQKGIDRVNKKATSKIQKVTVFFARVP